MNMIDPEKYDIEILRAKLKWNNYNLNIQTIFEQFLLFEPQMRNNLKDLNMKI